MLDLKKIYVRDVPQNIVDFYISLGYLLKFDKDEFLLQEIEKNKHLRGDPDGWWDFNVSFDLYEESVLHLLEKIPASFRSFEHFDSFTFSPLCRAGISLPQTYLYLELPVNNVDLIELFLGEIKTLKESFTASKREMREMLGKVDEELTSSKDRVTLVLEGLREYV